MKISTLLDENLKDQFDHEDTIKIDPDRDDFHDVVNKVLPTLIKMAYTHLVADKASHEKRHGPPSDDPEAYNFSFTRDELQDRVESLVNSICEKLKDISYSDMNDAISQVEKEFKEPLVAKKK